MEFAGKTGLGRKLNFFQPGHFSVFCIKLGLQDSDLGVLYIDLKGIWSSIHILEDQYQNISRRNQIMENKSQVSRFWTAPSHFRKRTIAPKLLAQWSWIFFFLKDNSKSFQKVFFIRSFWSRYHGQINHWNRMKIMVLNFNL